MPCKIVNNSGLEISGFEDMIQSLVSFSQNRFGFEKPPTLFLNSDLKNASSPLEKQHITIRSKEKYIFTQPIDIKRYYEINITRASTPQSKLPRKS